MNAAEGDFHGHRLFRFSAALVNGYFRHHKSQGQVVTNIFVGNLDSNATEEQLRGLFAAYGAVETITIVKDRDTGEPRGFAFVEMTQAAEAQAAIASLNGTVLNGRAMTVNEARPKLHRDPTRDSMSRDHRRHRI